MVGWSRFLFREGAGSRHSVKRGEEDKISNVVSSNISETEFILKGQTDEKLNFKG